MKKVYFLGPVGTYSELAAKKLFLSHDGFTLNPVSTIAKVVDLVNRDENSMGVLPIENSIEGIVRPAIDSIYKTDVKIQAQLDIKIEHYLISKGTKKDIEHIISHPQALAQSSKFILDNFSENIDLIETTSTAAAGYSLMDRDNSYAAIVSKNLSQELGFNIIGKNIGDIKDNKTRFVLICKNDLKIASPSRTSVVFNTKNEPGALLKILEIFKKYNLNLVYLESRPSKKVFGEYNFFADINKGIDEIQDAISEIRQECNYYKTLGSYPVL